MAVVTVRPVQEGDFARLGEIQVRCWRGPMAAYAPAAFIAQFDAQVQAGKYRQRVAEAGYKVWVGEVDGEVAGFVATKPHDGEPQGFVKEMGACYVDPAFARRGVGRAMIREVLHHEKEPLVVWGFSANLPAKGLYEATGGTKVAEVPAALDLNVPHTAYGWNMRK